jgi:penicillin-binding protein 2
MPRLIALRVMLLLLMTVLIGRLYQLQVVESDSQAGNRPEEIFSRTLMVPPRRGEIFAADGKTLLAESVPIYNLAVIPGRLPTSEGEPVRRAEVLARLSQVAELSPTLALSPTTALDARPALRSGLLRFGPLPAVAAGQPLTVTVAPADTLRALDLSKIYSDVLRLENPIEDLIDRERVRGYQSVVVREDISSDLAIALRENSNYLPGVQVVEGYRRRYPLSAEVPSLSHLLGYIGRVSECELVAENPASSWLSSLTDLVGHASLCGLIPKVIDPRSIGLPPYQVDDRIGKDGLEAAYEAELRGRMGIETLLVDALNRPVSGSETMRPVDNGQNLVLTIDTAFQTETARILQGWIDEGERRRQAVREQYKRDYQPIVAGSAVAVDLRTGRVLSMVSLPSYDNNVWVDPSRAAELQALLAPDDPKALEELLRLAPLTDRAIAGQYPPGSTLKQFVGATALQMSVIAVDTRLRDPGLLKLIERNGAPFELPNSVRNRDNGELTVVDALRLSSNVFFASVAGGNDQATNLEEEALRINGLGIDKMVEGLEWFHLGRPTGIDIAGEAPGLVPTVAWKAQAKREVWTTGDTYNTAIGQGDMLVTPLQLAVASGGIAVDGTVYRPHVVDRIVDGSGNLVREVTPEVLSKAPVDPLYLLAIREGMRQSVTDGLNIAARDECSGLSIAGKTGTAEFGPLLETPDKRLVRQSHAWFVGFAPYDNPQIAVAVLIEGVGDLGDGSSTMAVPAVTQIMQAYFKVAPPADAPGTCPALPVAPSLPPVVEPPPAVGQQP